MRTICGNISFGSCLHKDVSGRECGLRIHDNCLTFNCLFTLVQVEIRAGIIPQCGDAELR